MNQHNQPRRTVSQMQIMNYTRYRWLVEKKSEANRPPHRRFPLPLWICHAATGPLLTAAATAQLTVGNSSFDRWLLSFSSCSTCRDITKITHTWHSPLLQRRYRWCHQPPTHRATSSAATI